MIIKVSGEYLDFTEDIEIEKQANLFEDIAGTFGDFSYSFELPKTAKNLEILGVQTLMKTPSYNSKVDAILYSDSGEDLYEGFIRIESVTDTINCSFFSGNNNWFEACKANIRTFNYYRLDKDFTYANVVNSWSISNGIVWPLVDRGTLNARDTNTIYDNDLQPFVYVKDVVRTVLAQSGGIKLAGDLIKDPVYSSLVTTNNGLAGISEKLDAGLVYAGKTTGQTISSSSFVDVTFPDTTTEPFTEGSDNNWDGTQYTLTRDFIEAELEFKLDIDVTGASTFRIKVFQDADVIYDKWYIRTADITINKTIRLENIYSGSVLKIQINRTGTNISVKQTSTIKIKPIKLRKVFVSQLLPDLPANEYISSIFARFCVFASYDYKTKTINTKFLDNIKRAEPIDLSAYVQTIDKEYAELIDSYGQKTRYLYQESGADEINEYNSLNEIAYGGGQIEIDNAFIETETDFVELEEIAPYQIPVPFIGFSLPLLNYSSFEVAETVRFTQVIDNSGQARFRLSDTGIIAVGDLFRVTNSTNEIYNGVWRCTDVTTIIGVDYISADVLPYDTDATGTIELLTLTDELKEDQVTICNVPNTPLSSFTDTDKIVWYRTSENDHTSIALGYFWLPDVGKPINTIRTGLYFNRVNDPQCYQQGLLEAYFNTATKVLNDPVVLKATMFIPEKIFRDIDFLRPVLLRTEEFTGLFLINRITGYVGSHKECEVELIKLSSAVITEQPNEIITTPEPDPEPVPEYDYYLADKYGCGTCTEIEVNVFVKITSGTSMNIGNFYQPMSPDGFLYKVTATNPGNDDGIILTTSLNNATCELIPC